MISRWYALNPMEAQHGSDRGAPPATHPISQYAETVFQCRDHLMTVISASGYGVIYLTPNQLVDLSGARYQRLVGQPVDGSRLLPLGT